MKNDLLSLQPSRTTCAKCHCNYDWDELKRSRVDASEYLCFDCYDEEVPKISEEDLSPIEKQIGEAYTRFYEQGWNHMMEIACIEVQQFPLIVERLKQYKK